LHNVNFKFFNTIIYTTRLAEQGTVNAILLYTPKSKRAHNEAQNFWNGRRRAYEHSESAEATEGWGAVLRIPCRYAWLGRRYAQTDRQTEPRRRRRRVADGERYAQTDRQTDRQNRGGGGE
jgi:hypothetical protein